MFLFLDVSPYAFKKDPLLAVKQIKPNPQLSKPSAHTAYLKGILEGNGTFCCLGFFCMLQLQKMN